MVLASLVLAFNTDFDYKILIFSYKLLTWFDFEQNHFFTVRKFCCSLFLILRAAKLDAITWNMQQLSYFALILTNYAAIWGVDGL